MKLFVSKMEGASTRDGPEQAEVAALASGASVRLESFLGVDI
jgi:hypothetical protein